MFLEPPNGLSSVPKSLPSVYVSHVKKKNKRLHSVLANKPLTSKVSIFTFPYTAAYIHVLSFMELKIGYL